MGSLQVHSTQTPLQLLPQNTHRQRLQSVRIALQPIKGVVHGRNIRWTQYFKRLLHSYKHKYVGYDVILNNLPGQISLAILNPDLVHQATKMESVMKFRKNHQMLEMIYSEASSSLIFVQGSEWKQRRKILSNIFNYNFLLEKIPQISTICDRVFDRFEGQNNIATFKIDLGSLFSNIFGTVVTSLFIGMDESEELIEGKPFIEAFLEFTTVTFQLAFNPFVAIFGRRLINLKFNRSCHRYLHLKPVLRGFLRNQARRHIQNFRSRKSNGSDSKPSSIIEHLIEQMQDEPNLQEKLAEQTFTFINAGSDTTAGLLVATVLELYRNPQILAKVRKEIADKVQNKDSIQNSELKELTYIEWVFRQANRMYGPIPWLFDRVATQDLLLKDIPIRKGTNLPIYSISNFYNQKYFHQPFKFKPQRWEEPRYKTPQLQMITEMTFSAGPRACIGKNLAMIQGKIALIKFLQRYSDLKELHPRVFQFRGGTQFRHKEVQLTKS